MKRSQASRTSTACAAVEAATATPISARRCRSRCPVSATEAPGKRRLTSATSGRTADRFCFSERTSPSSTSRVRAPTYTVFPRSPPGRLEAPPTLVARRFAPRSSVQAALRPFGSRGPLSGPGLLPHLERLDDVGDPDIVVAEADAALKALADLGRVVLEPAQRIDREAVRDHDPVSDQASPAVAGYRAGADDASRHAADSRHPEDLPPLPGAPLVLPEDGLQHPLYPHPHSLFP